MAKKELSITKMRQKGVIAILTVVLVLIIIVIILGALEFSTYFQQKIYRNVAESVQAYYIAESGIEDALWRIKKDPSYGTRSYTLSSGGGIATINIGETNEATKTKTITSESNLSNIIRKIKVVYKIKQGTSFINGVQVGDYGINIGNNAIIEGNVFSNGNAIGQGGSQEVITVTGTIELASTASMSGLTIGGDAYTYNCQSSTIKGTLYCTGTGGFCPGTCDRAWTDSFDPISPKPFPISDSQINDWKNDAKLGGESSGGTYNGSLGPKQINGNLTVSSTLTVQGTIYVTGNISVDNNATIQLDSSYGPDSGIIIADGTITIGNKVTLQGSGQEGSSILLISTKNDNTNAVISVGNNIIYADDAILYSPGGRIVIGNSDSSNPAKIGQITGKGIGIGNNTTVKYKWGVPSPYFKSGPGASWGVQSWEEY